MKYTVKPQTQLPKVESQPDTPISELSIEALIQSTLLILDREVRNLKSLSARGKLDAASARDLREHAKLLFELKQREDDWLKNLTDDEIQAILDERKGKKNVSNP